MQIIFRPIGIIRTPYRKYAPYQPIASDTDGFSVTIYPEYAEGLNELSRFRYIYLIYHMNQVKKKFSLIVEPPWADGNKVGVFASRTPVRPNPMGISIVHLLRIEKNVIFTTGLDVLDETPLLDIKPYVKDLDTREDANYGWLDDLEDKEHLLLHIRGIPHDY